jgi:ABC-type multidrug transport system fused ATPase/permease subunit
MIHVKDLVKAFGEVQAVGASPSTPPGEIFAFLGPNGAGKTITIQMLTTLLRPTSGLITIDGLDPAERSLDVRRRFGIVLQDPSLDHELTAYENMDLHGVLYHVPRRARAERIPSLLTLFELLDRRDARVKTFSGLRKEPRPPSRPGSRFDQRSGWFSSFGGVASFIVSSLAVNFVLRGGSGGSSSRSRRSTFSRTKRGRFTFTGRTFFGDAVTRAGGSTTAAGGGVGSGGAATGSGGATGGGATTLFFDLGGTGAFSSGGIWARSFFAARDRFIFARVPWDWANSWLSFDSIGARRDS